MTLWLSVALLREAAIVSPQLAVPVWPGRLLCAHSKSIGAFNACTRGPLQETLAAQLIHRMRPESCMHGSSLVVSGIFCAIRPRAGARVSMVLRGRALTGWLLPQASP